MWSSVCTLPILGIDVDLPVLALMDWWAAVLSAGAMMAMLRFKGIRPAKAVWPDLLIGFKSMPYVMRYNHFRH